jgi:Fur family transcriptional regulator, zinc uptake regulator
VISLDINEALNVLKSKGYKHTDKREDILNIFIKNKSYLTARNVLHEIKDQYTGLSFDTIYRNLSLFVQLEILEETEFNGEKHYQLKCESSHCHHLICIGCGFTKDVDVCPLEEQIPQSANFKITGHKFEVYGYCSACQ